MRAVLVVLGAPRGGKRYDFQIERGGNSNLAWIGAMNLKCYVFFYTNLSAALSQKRMEYLFYLFFDIMLCHKEKFKFLAPIHAK